MNILSLLLTDTVEELFSCTGNKGMSQIVKLLGFAYKSLIVIVPIVIILFAIIRLIKAISSSKENDIKKAYASMIRMIILGITVFVIASIVLVLVNVIDDNFIKDTNTKNCIDLFLGE